MFGMVKRLTLFQMRAMSVVSLVEASRGPLVIRVVGSGVEDGLKVIKKL